MVRTPIDLMGKFVPGLRSGEKCNLEAFACFEIGGFTILLIVLEDGTALILLVHKPEIVGVEANRKKLVSFESESIVAQVNNSSPSHLAPWFPS